MNKLVVLSGAGISRESGLQTFRDGDGLWEGYDVQEVATPEAWKRNPELVQRFYNERRKAVRKAQPNDGHRAIAELERAYSVTVITQNIDDLHERAGSTSVIHLHGEILKSQSDLDPQRIYEVEGDTLEIGMQCELGSQLRPHVVWFGEPVPKMEIAVEEVASSDILLIVGTSLVVYPAAGLVEFASTSAELFLVDPVVPALPPAIRKRTTVFEEEASSGLPKLAAELIQRAKAA